MPRFLAFPLRLAFCLGVTSIAVLPSYVHYAREEGCLFGGRRYSDLQTWIHQSFFNVTCRRGGVKVLNCITPRGAILPLGTQDFAEGDYKYSCRVRAGKLLATPTPYPTRPTQISFTTEGEGQEEELAADYADECLAGRSDYTREGFMISCVTHRILGCVDHRGDLVRNGLYLQSSQRATLKECRLMDDGKRARIDSAGCFIGNASEPTDLDDAQQRVALGGVWRSGDLELRCDENEGWLVNRCFTADAESGGYELAGSAWVDNENVLNICK